MARRPWSFKEDRRLMELAKSSTSLEEAAKLLGRSPDAIKRMALRLGLSLEIQGRQEGLASAARDTSWTGASASSIDEWQPPVDMGRSLSALSISPHPDVRLSNDED